MYLTINRDIDFSLSLIVSILFWTANLKSVLESNTLELFSLINIVNKERAYFLICKFRIKRADTFKDTMV